MNQLETITTWTDKSNIPLLALPHANAATDAAAAGAILINQPEGRPHSLLNAMSVVADGLARNHPAIILCGAGDLTAPDQGVIRAQFAEWPLVIIRLQDLLHEPGIENDSAYACDWDTTVAQSLGLPGVPLLVRATPFDADIADEMAECCAAASRHKTPICVLTTRAAVLSGREHEPPMLFRSAGGQADAKETPLQPLRLPSGEALELELHRLTQKVANIDDLAHAEPDIDPDAETLVVSLGLASPAVREAVASVRTAGGRASMSILRTLWPVPEKTLKRALTPFVRRVLVVERNPGLYARILRAVLPSVQIESLCRFDGEAIDAAQIARRITGWPCG